MTAFSPPPEYLAGKRIIIVIGVMEVGGAESQALLLARLLRQHAECFVKIIALSATKGRLINLCEENQIPWETIPFRIANKLHKLIPRLALCALALRKQKPDVIISFVTIPNVVCGLVWRFTGARMHIWSQRSAINWQKRLGQEFAIKWTPVFVANSKSGAAYLNQVLKAPVERIKVIYNGIELPAPILSRSEWRLSLSISEDTFIGVMVANITPYKDHVTLLRAWKLLKEDFPEKRTALLLAGYHGQRYEEVLSLTNQLNIEKEVHFLGPVDDISGLLGAADLGILISPSEGLSNAVLEYMAAGLPVTGTAVSGIEEALGEGGKKHLSQPGDVVGLSTNLKKFVLNPELCVTVGRMNRLRVEDVFSQQVFAETWQGLIMAYLVL